MDASALIRDLLDTAIKTRQHIEGEAALIQQSIAQYQQRLNELAQQHTTIAGEEAGYRKVLAAIQAVPDLPAEDNNAKVEVVDLAAESPTA